MERLVNSDDIWLVAAEAFEREAATIVSLVPASDIQHTGSTAIPHSLTKGDLDIQIRVEEELFGPSLESLSVEYPAHRPELWTPTLALFHIDEHRVLPVGVALTVIGSPADEFSRLRDLLIADPDLLERYNDLKRHHEGSSVEEYRRAKATFFGPLGCSYLLQRD